MTRSVFALTLSDDLCLTNNKILQCLDKTCMEKIVHVFNHVCQSWVTLVSKIWCRGQSWHLDRWVSCLWLNVKKKKHHSDYCLIQIVFNYWGITSNPVRSKVVHLSPPSVFISWALPDDSRCGLPSQWPLLRMCSTNSDNNNTTVAPVRLICPSLCQQLHLFRPW